MTVLPLMAAIRYQVEPDLAVGHVAFQLPPETVPATVSVALAERVVLTDELVEVPERMLMALQAGTIVAGVAALAVGTPTDNAPRSAATAVRTRGARRVCRATRIWCGVLRSNMGDEPSTQTVGRPTTQRSHIPTGPYRTTLDHTSTNRARSITARSRRSQRARRQAVTTLTIQGRAAPWRSRRSRRH